MNLHARTACGGLLACLALTGAPAGAKELRLTYGCVETVSQPDKPVSQRAYATTVGLGRGYFYALDSTRFQMADFEHRRLVTSVSETERVDCPLYAIVAFRDMEVQNRLGLRRSLAAMGIRNRGPQDPILAIESEFGMKSGVRPDKGERLVRVGGERGLFWRINDDTATVVELSDTPLGPDDEAMLGRYLLYQQHLHPDVRAAVLAEHRVPRRLICRWRTYGQITTVDMTLQGSEVVADSTCRPPATMAATPAFDSTLAASLAVIRASMVGCAASAPVAQSVLDSARADVAAGRALDAVLRGAEYAMRTGLGAPDYDAGTRAGIQADPRVRAYLAAVGQMEKQAADAATALRAIDRAGLQRGHLIDLELATALGMRGASREAADLFLDVLRQEPCLGTAWTDLATVFINEYDTYDGWICLEAARQVAPPNAAYLERFIRQEKRLAEKYPEFF